MQKLQKNKSTIIDVFKSKNSAAKRGLEFSITKEDIKIPSRCPLLEVEFTNTYANPTENKDYVPSLDRIDNTKGYTPDNVWVISFKANRMKNTATIPELLLFSKNIIKNI